jgi:hypothetical protein
LLCPGKKIITSLNIVTTKEMKKRIFTFLE